MSVKVLSRSCQECRPDKPKIRVPKSQHQSRQEFKCILTRVIFENALWQHTIKTSKMVRGEESRVSQKFKGHMGGWVVLKDG